MTQQRQDYRRGWKLENFTGKGYDKGRPVYTQIAWMCTQGLLQQWFVPARTRASVLRWFGADIAPGALIRHRVRIHWPWKLSVGANAWIGEGTWILNLEPVHIGPDSVISQDVLLCTGSHDHRSPSFEFDNGPITIEEGAWVAARATVLRGVTVGARAIVGATALVVRDVPPGSTVLAPKAS